MAWPYWRQRVVQNRGDLMVATEASLVDNLPMGNDFDILVSLPSAPSEALPTGLSWASLEDVIDASGLSLGGVPGNVLWEENVLTWGPQETDLGGGATNHYLGFGMYPQNGATTEYLRSIIAGEVEVHPEPNTSNSFVLYTIEAEVDSPTIVGQHAWVDIEVGGGWDGEDSSTSAFEVAVEDSLANQAKIELNAELYSGTSPEAWMSIYTSASPVNWPFVIQSDEGFLFAVDASGPLLRAPDGNLWRLVVDNSGALSTEAA